MEGNRGREGWGVKIVKSPQTTGGLFGCWGERNPSAYGPNPEKTVVGAGVEFEQSSLQCFNHSEFQLRQVFLHQQYLLCMKDSKVISYES